jgi:hypothetical protein
MSLSYIGDDSWSEAGEVQYASPPHDIPTARQKWIGRSDTVDTFRAAHAVGSAFLGGYITDNTPQEHTPSPGLATVELLVLLPPDFEDYLASDQNSTKTASKSADVTASGIIPGETALKCTHEVTFKSPATKYTYFAATRPSGALFSAPLTSASPVIIRSVMKASANGQERTFAGAVAPAPIVSALTLSTVNVGNEPEAEPIPGTPWFRCSEVWSRELEGD